MPRSCPAAALIAAAVVVSSCDATALQPSHISADPPESGSTTLVVDYIIDGDTFTATTPAGDEVGRVRLVGIDAPELDPPECGAREARDYLDALIPAGSTVQLTTDSRQGARDHYGRLLGFVGLPEHPDVGRQLIEDGHARITGHGHPRRASYTAAQTAAEMAGTGSWGACPRP